MDNGEWTMENGQWRMDNGEWTMENGEWTMFLRAKKPPSSEGAFLLRFAYSVALTIHSVGLPTP